MNNKDNIPPFDSAEMVACEDCGHMVPEMNLEIHKARACSARARPSFNSNDTRNANQKSLANSNSNLLPSSCLVATTPFVQNTNNKAASSTSTTTTTTTIEIDDNDDDSDIMQVDEVVNLLNDAEEQEAAAENSNSSSNSNNEAVDGTNDESAAGESSSQWACPRCTLFNSMTQAQCEACQYRNPDIVRAADPTRRERLINDHYHHSGDDDLFDFHSPLFSSYSTRSSSHHHNGGGGSSNNPGDYAASYVGGGALLGGMLGAAGAYMRGRPMSSGVLEGAMSGAVSGAFMREVMRSPPDNDNSRNNTSSSSTTTSSQSTPLLDQQQAARNHRNEMSRARSAAAMGQPAYPSMTNSENVFGNFGSGQQRTNNNNNETATRPRPSFRIIRRQMGPGGVTTTVISSSSSSSSNPGNDMMGSQAGTSAGGRGGSGGGGGGGGGGQEDPFLNFMLHSLFNGGMGGAGGGLAPGMPVVDGMNYEQLLQAFGDGTEHLAAEEGTIHSLPTATITDPIKELPEDARKCAICLEDFDKGEVRKTLPCLHGFHDECVNKWLRTNGACPVCKHRVNE